MRHLLVHEGHWGEHEIQHHLVQVLSDHPKSLQGIEYAWNLSRMLLDTCIFTTQYEDNINVPIKISLPSDDDSWYAARISEYVMPPATKTISRCRTSLVAPRCGARCQFGFALRKDPAGVGEAVLRRLATLLVAVGASRTYGNIIGSSLLPT